MDNVLYFYVEFIRLCGDNTVEYRRYGFDYEDYMLRICYCNYVFPTRLGFFFRVIDINFPVLTESPLNSFLTFVHEIQDQSYFILLEMAAPVALFCFGLIYQIFFAVYYF